jgi:LCP family protein required for cell wall assembly
MFARIPPNLLARATLVRSAVIVVALIVVVVGCNLLMAKQPVAVVASPSPTPTVSPSPTASPTPSPTPKPTPSPLLSKRITILVLGNDSNASRLARGMGKLTDSIIVLSVNAKHTQISMISFPRDIVDIPMDNGSIWSGKINSITYYRGEAAMKRAISATIGQPINYYIEVNMEDFGRLVNAIHGIDVIVPASIYDPSIGFSIRAGRRHLDGNAALSYSRSRHTTSDWDRDARQQLVLAAIVRKLVDPKTKVDIPELIRGLHTLQTDMPIRDIAAFIQVARLSAKAKVVGQVLAPPYFAGFTGIEPGTNRGWIQEPNLSAIRRYARSVLTG